jgi:hypothetical protein
MISNYFEFDNLLFAPLFLQIYHITIQKKTSSIHIFIDSLASGFRPELFGNWLQSNLSLARECQSDIPQPHLAVDEQGNAENNVENDEENFDLNKIPPKMLNFIYL